MREMIADFLEVILIHKNCVLEEATFDDPNRFPLMAGFTVCHDRCAVLRYTTAVEYNKTLYNAKVLFVFSVFKYITYEHSDGQRITNDPFERQKMFVDLHFRIIFLFETNKSQEKHK